jgi:mitogen-activated protein kinase kinase
MMKLGDMHLPPSACSSPFSAASSSGSTTSHTNQTKFLSVSGAAAATPFANFSKIVDPSGRLNFGGKAVVHSHGVDFSNGSSFSINMNELTLMEELGKGNYGTVQKVFHKPTKVVMAMKVSPPMLLL